MQRLRQDDPTAVALELGFRHLCLPMRAPAEPMCPEDTREPGELLWPEYFDEARVAAKEFALGPQQTAGQYGQVPVPEGGAMFRTEHLRTWRDLPRTFDALAIGVDVASTTGARSDYSVCVVIGRKGEHYFMLDVLRAKLEMPELLSAVKGLKSRYPRAELVIEQADSGRALTQILTRERFRVQEVKASRGKVARAQVVLPIFAAGGVYLPPYAPWLGAFTDELLAFPYGTHDDQADAVVHGLSYLAEHAGESLLPLAMKVWQTQCSSGFFRSNDDPIDPRTL
jgi:predicted phage terminase large subunit-like protein